MKQRIRIFRLTLWAYFLVAAVFFLPGTGHAAAAIDSFNPNVTCNPEAVANNVCVLSVAEQADGKIVIGGSFHKVGTTSIYNLARLNPDGTVDTGFKALATNYRIDRVAVQPTDQKIVIGGHFTTITDLSTGQTLTRSRLARLNPDGSLDAAFDPNADNPADPYMSSVTALAVQADGKILVGGHFTHVGGALHPFFARLLPDGTVDPGFTQQVDSAVLSIVVLETEQKILIAGSFFKAGCASYDTSVPGAVNCVAGTPVRYVARLNLSDGALDPAWLSEASGVGQDTVATVAGQVDGKVILGGAFTSAMNGSQMITGRNSIARFNSDGLIDLAYDPNANGEVRTLALQADGSLMVGGFFTSIGGKPRNYIARLNVDGSADLNFDPNANNVVGTLAVQADGKIISAGTFTVIGGQTRNYLARLYDPATTTTLTSNNNQTPSGSAAIFTAKVASNAGTPTGTVNFKDGAISIGTATLSGGTAIFTITTLAAGPHSITAEFGGDTEFSASSSTALSHMVVNADQMIVFEALPAKTYGDAPFTLSATATSGLPVSYSSFNPGVATISGSLVTIVSAGTATITASQAGDGNYKAATPVSQLLTVNKKNQTITFSALPAKNLGDAPFPLSATADSGLPVTYTSSDENIATVSGTTVTIVSYGTTTITASQAGDNNHNAATPVSQPLAVNKKGQTITFGTLPAKTYGDAPFPLGATADSGLAVAYTSSDENVATISGTTVTIVSAGTTTITASQAGSGDYAAAIPVPQLLAVNKKNQTVTFSTLPVKNPGDAAFPLSATADSGLPVTYSSSDQNVTTISGSIVTIVSAGTATITASQAGDNNYNAATPVSQPLTVIKKNQTIAFGALPAKIYGDVPFPLSATADSGLLVAYTSSNENVVTISGSIITIVSAGTATITASQGGDNTYNSATPVSQSLTVSKKNQTVTFSTLPIKNPGDAAFPLGATADSGLAVTYTSSDENVATVSGSIVTIVSAGTATITASQAGDINYNAATPVSQPLTVSKKNQTITFGALPARTYGDAPFQLAATADSGLTVIYTSSDENVATISGTTVTIVSAGTATITASQAGDNIYNAAIPVSQPLMVSKKNQTVTFGALPARTYGDAPFDLTATSDSGLTVTYTSSDVNVATISGTTVTIMNAGTATITASQAGSGNYAAAAPVPQLLTVNQLEQTITFSALPAKTYGNVPFTLSATATSGLPVTFSSSNPAVATVNGTTVTIVGAGTTTITASQAGTANYLAAVNVQQPLIVAQASQALTFDAFPTKAYGDADFVPGATANSGLAVSYTSSNTAVATIAGGNIHIAGAGTAVITASQAGNSNYYAAADITQTLTVNKSLTAITVTSSQNPQSVNGYVTFTATVSGAGTTGTVTFKDGVNTLETVALSGGSAAYTTSALAPGLHSITASYNGDGNYLASTSTVLEQTTVSFASTTQVTSSSSPSIFHGSVTFTATVSGAEATGTVTFKDNGIELSSGTVTLSNGTASYTTTALGAGTHLVTATYNGDANYSASTSAVLSQVVRYADGNFNGGNVDMTDALKALRIAAGIDAPSTLDIDHGDVSPLMNGKPQPDGKIDMGDLVVVLKLAAGLISW